MIHRSIGVADWISRQPKSVQEAGESRGEEIIRQVMLQEPGVTETLHESSSQDSILGPKEG